MVSVELKRKLRIKVFSLVGVILGISLLMFYLSGLPFERGIASLAWIVMTLFVAIILPVYIVEDEIDELLDQSL
jgi:hypothetical protein